MTIRLLTLFFIGFAEAAPLPLTGSILSMRLIEEGVSKGLIAWFLLLHLPYTLKILWAPLINALSLPLLSRIGERKSWMVFSLFGSLLSLAFLGFLDPIQNQLSFSIALFLVPFFSGAVYIAGISYEIESLDEKEYAEGSASVITGYRVGLLAASALSLLIAEHYSWQVAYYLLALISAISIFLICIGKEPYKSQRSISEWKEKVIGKAPFSWWLVYIESFKKPFTDLSLRPKWGYLLSFILMYKLAENLSDGVLGVFYREIGFSKKEIAESVKIVGMIASLAGAVAGAYLIRIKGLIKTLAFSGIAHSFSFAMLAYMAFKGAGSISLYEISLFQYFTSAISMTAFVAFLWTVCSKPHAATQYALIWSLLSLKKNLLISFGVAGAEGISWPYFFALTFIISIVTVSLSFIGLKLYLNESITAEKSI